MNKLFEKIFRYIPRETSISLFGLEHWLYIIVIAAAVISLSIVFAKKSEKTKTRVLNITATLVIFVYLFDFFVQPFWDGELLKSKLPFHLCTLVGVLIPFANYSKKFNFAKQTIVVWAVLAPLIFIVLPLNYINREVEPYSYPIIQTFLFHGLEVFWGVFMLVSKKVVLRWRDIWQPIVGLFPMAAWATLGQELYYPNTLGENFLMLRTDISDYAPQWMYVPALFIAASAAIALLYLIYWGAIKIKNKAKNKQPALKQE